MPTENQTPPVTPAAPPPADTAPAPTSPTPPVENQATPFAVFPTADAFNDRVDREARKRIRELGIEDPDRVKEILTEHTRLSKEAEERRQAELSEVERAREAREQAERNAIEAREVAERSAQESAIMRLCMDRGIRNSDYALYAVDKARRAGGEDFDPAAHLDAMLKDSQSAAALGATPPRSTPATNTSAETDPKPKDPDAPPTAKAVADMTPEEFRRYRSAKYGY